MHPSVDKKTKMILPSNLGDLKNQSSFWSIISCLVYSLCSISMVLTNKAISVSVSPDVKVPEFLIVWFQCFVAVFLLQLYSFLGWIDIPDFSIKTAKQWLPVNVFFVGMLTSGFISLVYVNVPVVTVFKNVANLFTVFGDWYFFNEKISLLTIFSILLMTLGAVMSGFNDLQFTLFGYFFLIVNCLCTASYVLSLRFASTHIKLTKFGMIYYNNLLSLFLLTPICLMKGEVFHLLLHSTSILTPLFIFNNILASIFGFSLNFVSIWCISLTSSTTYSIVGSLNKIPITVLGFFLFGAPMTRDGVVFITLATLGGLVYGYSKLQSSNPSPPPATLPSSVNSKNLPSSPSSSSSLKGNISE